MQTQPTIQHNNPVLKITNGDKLTAKAKLVKLYTKSFPPWKLFCKRAVDIIGAISLFILLSPLLLFIAIRTLLHSKGGIIYSQERIGLKGRPFIIYKFRSMIANAEKNGPALSSLNDERITSWGRFMRKWKLDELPQLWNILIGDMSFVGPRPERKIYIDQLIDINPSYAYLLNRKPGLTSLGMIEFGYATTLSEMTVRMEYDLQYIENPSLRKDFQIICKTLLLILWGKGK
ncbi:MAG: sugar transferase [Sediminibacterium sp.]|nr:sugar transferase [Sediminibacterium sp.]MBX9779072.1 sugar transferase [Chitinophagaceae bacterium]